MGWLRDHLTAAGRAELAVRRWESIAARSEFVPGWAGPPVTAMLQFGAIGPPIAISLAYGGIADALSACAWAYVGISKTAAELAQLPAVVQKRVAGKWQRDENHKLNELITRPHGPADSPPNWSWGQLIQCIATYLQMDSMGSVVRIARAGDRPVALWPLMFAPITIDTNTQGFPVRYHHGTENLSPQDVVHFTFFSPGSYIASMPPLRAALRAVKIDAVSSQRIEANLINRIAPGCIITVSGLMNLSPAMKAETLKSVRDQCGTSAQDGTPLVGGDGWSIIAPPPTATDLGLSEARREARKEILAVLGMPEALAVTVDSDRASLREKRGIWWEYLFPFLGNIYDQLNRQLVSPAYGDDVRLWYDLSGTQIALALLSDRCAVAKQLVDLGFPANDAAKRVDLEMPHHPALDEPNQKQVIAGREPADAAPQDVETPEPADPDDDGDAA